MPIEDYGFSQKFGWLVDRFGVSWQLDLPNEYTYEHVLFYRK